MCQNGSVSLLAKQSVSDCDSDTSLKLTCLPPPCPVTCHCMPVTVTAIDKDTLTMTITLPSSQCAPSVNSARTASGRATAPTGQTATGRAVTACVCRGGEGPSARRRARRGTMALGVRR